MGEKLIWCQNKVKNNLGTRTEHSAENIKFDFPQMHDYWMTFPPLVVLEVNE